jgi:hypothetical protein
MSFPGIEGLPSAIAIPADGGTYYVRSDKATWSELLVGRQVRVENVQAAQAKLDAYDETLEALRPFMESDDRVTVAAAVEAMKAAA